MLSHVDATRIVARRYEEALAKAALLQRRNNELAETVRRNEIQTARLIAHYRGESDAQTDLVAELRAELRAGEERERERRARTTRDRGTMIDEEEVRSREQEYIALVNILEDETRALKEDRDAREEEFARRGQAHRADVRQSFLQNIDVLREQVTGAVCGEVHDALTDTLADNERLTREFRQLLGETEQLQASRERKDRALAETKRELELLRQQQLLATSVGRDRRREDADRRRDASPVAPEASPREDEGVEDDVDDGTRERTDLGKYFRKCIQNARDSR